MDILNIIPVEWQGYITQALLWLGAVVVAASAITPLTPTKKDDTIVEWLKDFIARFSVFGQKTQVINPLGFLWLVWLKWWRVI